MPQVQALVRMSQPQQFVLRIIFHAADLTRQIPNVPQRFEPMIDIHHPHLPTPANGPGQTVE